MFILVSNYFGKAKNVSIGALNFVFRQITTSLDDSIIFKKVSEPINLQEMSKFLKKTTKQS